MLHDRRTAMILPLALLWRPSSFADAGESAPARKLGQPDLDIFRDARDPRMIRLPSGLFECDGLLLETGTRLVGAGQGRTILRLADGADRAILRNADSKTGNNGIEIRDLTVDGASQKRREPVNGVHMERVSHSIFDMEIRDCHGTGFLLSGGSDNVFASNMYCHGNGRECAGYGLYIFGSSNNLVHGGRYDDNCIGIAVEASRAGVYARNNRIIDVRCVANRADFNQSGAGVHFEQSEGGICDGIVKNAVCLRSTGVGINNTACRLTIIGARCVGNRESGVVTIAADGIDYEGLVCEGNALGSSTGYRSEMRFDDSAMIPGTSGRVTGCYLRGRAPDGGFKTMSPHSAVRFAGNRVEGYRFPYNLHGRADSVS